MAVLAARLPRVRRGGSNAARDVLADRDRLHVPSVDAQPVSTQMVDHESIHDRPNLELVGDAMNHLLFAVDLDPSVALRVLVTGPDPALIRVARFRKRHPDAPLSTFHGETLQRITARLLSSGAPVWTSAWSSKVGDRGIDGVIGFNIYPRQRGGRALVSVKGGRQIGPQFVRDLLGTVQTQGAEMGVLITMYEPTRGMLDATAHGGTYRWPVNGPGVPTDTDHHDRGAPGR